jgi:TonB-like protein
MQVLVAFDNGKSRVYARVSGWNHIYLWTFRNFRSLPQTILNQRQQKLMANLYRTASVMRPRELDEATVIGTLEEFSLPSPVLATTTAAPSAPGFSGTSARDLQDRSGFGFRPAMAGWTVAAGVLLLFTAAFAWHQLRAASSVGPTGNAVYTPPVSSENKMPADHLIAPNARAPVVKPPTTTETASAQPAPRKAPAPVNLPAMISSRLSNPQAYGNRVHHAVAATRTGKASGELHRLLISGPPRKIVYPVCPDTETRGKVSLKAVVDLDGGVSHVKVLAGDRVLAAAAIAAVRQWRYQPFSDAAPAAERETNITVSFISSEVVAVSFPDAVPMSR